MTDIIKIVIETAYTINMIIVLFFILKFIKKINGDTIPLILIMASWIAGEFFVHQDPQALGFAFYGLGNLILLLYAVNLFGGKSVRLSYILIFFTGLIIFTGYFLPERIQGQENFNVINSAIVLLYISNALIFGINKTKNRWIYVSLFMTLALWMSALQADYLISGTRIKSYDHALMLIFKSIMTLLLTMLAYRYFIQFKSEKETA